MHVLDQPIRNESRETVSQQKRIFANILTELARFYMTVAVQQEEHVTSNMSVIKDLESEINGDKEVNDNNKADEKTWSKTNKKNAK